MRPLAMIEYGRASRASRLVGVLDEVGKPQRHVLAFVHAVLEERADKLPGRILEPVDARGD